jgi:hypothetical protein
VEIRSLEEFINLTQEKIDRLVKDAKVAQDSFNQCVEYFGNENENKFFLKFLLISFKVKYHVHKVHRISSRYLLNFNAHIRLVDELSFERKTSFFSKHDMKMKNENEPLPHSIDRINVK